ncbi:MAG TPA: serine/threonine-protein kinase [Polyangiaceae bacterium]|nr:serine/threonine-protein kinase [Polyangiaceae bacterium]
MDSSGAKVGLPREGPPAGQEEPSASRLRAADVADDAPRAIAGKRVGRYSLLFPIASGGMAQVWAGKPEGGGLARTVAIKLVRPEYASDEEYARMFIDEAMVASSIHHPNVCEIHELGRDGDLLFMVLEWVAGDSLSGLVQRGSELRPLPDEIAARIVADACAGLHAAHEAIGPDGQPLGIVHRDVSPPNILVSVHGHVKVSDFGIAKARHQLHSRTRTGEIKGKFAYIPPEQILGRGVDRRADVYAMGCVLYVATLGLRPFGSGAGALGKIVRGKFRLPRELREDYPEGLEAIIVKALAADPSKRYQTADEMRLALEQWLVTSGHVVVHGDVSRVVRERMTPERRKLVDAILSSSRAVPEALAQQLLALAAQEKTDTPTATSGLVVHPPGFRERMQSMARASDSDSTQLDPAAAAAVPPAPRPFATAPTSITMPPPKPNAAPALPIRNDTASPTGKAPPPKPERRSATPPAPFEPVPVAVPVVRAVEPELTTWTGGQLRPKTGLWVALGVAAAAAGIVGLYGLFG